MSVWAVVAVAVGGALGSVLRYAVMAGVGRWAGSGFPWGTLVVNVAGSLIMGILVEIVARKWSLPGFWQVFLFVGVLGGFTTFSTFSLDLAMLMDRHAGLAAVYAVGSVVVGTAALFVGMALVRWSMS
ncbi:fluoride efflux transporter CrcB [Haematospirillum sp. H1815]|uniref:fluoride efflux transporter CrcB n=1 Tax=Haematospirillum sp. H1815 TaxID=2723108 RepID=UPI00143A89F4|nr:fluoride efflux transporter CrcB [Haematospirillum sp. H1815]NKD77838.1 fluoride efflux transporter CrcB [Haematospirillum sp. H1815]